MREVALMLFIIGIICTGGIASYCSAQPQSTESPEFVKLRARVAKLDRDVFQLQKQVKHLHAELGYCPKLNNHQAEKELFGE